MKVKLLTNDVDGYNYGQVVEVEKYIPQYYHTYKDPQVWEILSPKPHGENCYTYQPVFTVNQKNFEIL